MPNKKTNLPVKRDPSGAVLVKTLPAEAVAKVVALPTPPAGSGVFVETGVALVVGHAYVTRDRVLRADEIYFDKDARPKAEGPWLGEADKVAWRDEATGYECIMMRDRDGGFLKGFVGVPPSHPLYGYEEEAIPKDIGIEVHGGLSYAKICEQGPTPDPRYVPVNLRAHARRVCHSPPPEMRAVPIKHATDYRVQHDDAWWFGFSCDQIYDLAPRDRHDRGRYLKSELGAVYRDDTYVVNEISHLASQLSAIERGVPVPERCDDRPPPIGLDPRAD